MTPKLTVNLGVRWDYFGPINETEWRPGKLRSDPLCLARNWRAHVHRSRKRKRQPVLCPLTPPAQASDARASSICWRRMASRLTQTNRVWAGTSPDAKAELRSAHRLSLCNHRKLVARGGFGLFYNSFENQGYGPNIGENYPFVFNITPTIHANPADPSCGFAGRSTQLQQPVQRVPDRRSGWHRVL